MVRVVIVALATWMATSAVSASEAHSQASDTSTVARALVPLLTGVQERLRPRMGIVPGHPQPSPFTGTVTTLVSFGIGRKEVPVDPKVVDAMKRLQAWNPDDKGQTTEAVLFDHWLTQLTVKAAALGPMNCDAACVVERFTKPDDAFGRSQKDRDAMRDQVLLEALADAVEELEP